MRTAVTAILLMAFAGSAMPFETVRRPDKVLTAPPAPKFTDAERQAELARRRAAVAARMPSGSMLILFSAEPKLYTNDVDYVYRQENNLFYLTGLKQDGATFVMTKDGSGVTETVFLPKRVPLREKWEGRMYSREQASAISGLKNFVDSSERDAFLTAVKEKRGFTSAAGDVSISTVPSSLYLLLPMAPQDENGHREFRVENEFSKQVSGPKIENAQPIFAELRHVKSPYELKMLQHAIDISTEAHMRAMATVGRADWEYEVHAEVEYTFRRRNADSWGYPSIVGCGPNATTLHYVESQSPVRKGDLLLLDVGAEYEHYTADVTRTFPVSGKFTKEQADIYQIVFDAQEAAAAATKPGATFQDASIAANKVIREGLFRLGLITDVKSQQFQVWNFHGLGHWLGMNVHDVGRYGDKFKPGMVFTNEPGIYIREDALENLPDTPENKAFIEKVRPVFERYKNIGVRIEDDILVTDSGAQWMTAKLPRTIADIEAFMRTAPKSVLISGNLTLSPTQIFFTGAEASYFAPHVDGHPGGVTMRSGYLHSHGG